MFALLVGCSSSHMVRDPDGPPGSGSDAATGSDAAPASDRDRLLASYLAYLKAHPGQQTNGLDGAQLPDVCALWSKLDPSSQSVFLTITARLEGSVIAADHSTMLSHVTKLYRLVGGDGATASSPGSCGGGEANRMIMSQDAALLAAQSAAFAMQGGNVIADANHTGSWRNSHDLGGTHAPFDQSDETNDGAPRGQTQYFKDPASAVANAPLGRTDLMTLVDPYALEMDQDYDCTHNSNPMCSYTLYGAACLPKTSKLGIDIYGDNYGAVDRAWKPTGC